jgi:hypothetical protein
MYHGQVLTILTFSHHVHITQKFSGKRMQHTAIVRFFFIINCHCQNTEKNQTVY